MFAEIENCIKGLEMMQTTCEKRLEQTLDNEANRKDLQNSSNLFAMSAYFLRRYKSIVKAVVGDETE